VNPRRTAAAIAAIAATALAAGCGLPTSGHIERMDPRTVPFGLLRTAPPGTPAPAARGPATDLYFVQGDRLVTAARRVVGDNIPAEAVRLLLDGPTTTEAARGLTSDVPAQTRLISLDLSGSVATVDLSSEFGTVGGSDQVLAVAQIVYTLTASRYIDSIRFAINGKLTEVPDGSGSLASAPRTRQDYPRLAPAG
jgi:spore germination protein GerM